VWPQAGLLQYFDALGDTRTGRRILGKLARWLLQDGADKGVELPYSSPQQLSLQLAPPGMPQQVCVCVGGGVAWLFRADPAACALVPRSRPLQQQSLLCREVSHPGQI
jgi:hypothetical protein